MSRGAKLAVIAGILVAGAGVYYVVSPACACVTLDELTRAHLRSDMDDVREAQQTFIHAHRRYARTLDELASDSLFRSGLDNVKIREQQFASVLRFEAVTDSSFRLEGTIEPSLRCALLVTPATRADAHRDCTGEAARR